MPLANSSFQPFSLEPFEQTPQTDKLTIRGTASREATKLRVAYGLEGAWEKVAMPSAAFEKAQREKPVRRDRLWQTTCFEFFLAKGKQHTRAAPYWEFNLSPDGDWNVFSLCGYRQGLTEEGAIAQLPFKVSTSQAGLHLDIEIEIAPLISPDQPIRLGVSMVVLLETGGGVEETFWAIAHPGPEADFHHPDSFALQL